MRAYTIAMGLVLFNLSIAIAGSLGIVGPLSGETTPAQIQGTEVSYENWGGILLSSIGIITGIVSLVFHIPVGATIFAFLFAFSNFGVASTLSKLVTLGYINSTFSGAMSVILLFVFFAGFIQLASTGMKGAR